LTAFRLQIAGDQVQEGRLAGSVGTDNSDQLTVVDIDVEVVGGDYRAEGAVDPDGPENGAGISDGRPLCPCR
jgi:hypothetical protein